MKKASFFPILCFCAVAAFSQKPKEDYFGFKKDGTPENDVSKAAYFLQRVMENDTTIICRYYQAEGPLIRWETFYDTTLQIPNGRFAWYNKKGDLDSTGYCYRGKKDRTWIYGYDKKGKPLLTEKYQKGILLQRINYKTRKVFANGIETDLQDPVITQEKTGAMTLVNDKPATYVAGGIPGWMDYLANSIQTPARFIGIAGPNSEGRVGVEFYISTNGKTNDLFIYHSTEWSVDMEAMRVIRNSPPWNPALKAGVLVTYPQKQMLTFVVKP
ncbi:MAG: energy transducer TonB [Bacteroidota bacterium]|nr:energy transducer TonB [Bacteroidota bacterium]